MLRTIRIREPSSEKLRHRAEIRIHRHGYPLFNESKTFNTSRLAENWIVKREAEIDKNPEIS